MLFFPYWWWLRCFQDCDLQIVLSALRNVMFFFKSCERQEEMVQLEHEREVALMEQEMMERLKAEQLLFQQVRPESSVVPRAPGVAPLVR